MLTSAALLLPLSLASASLPPVDGPRTDDPDGGGHKKKRQGDDRECRLRVRFDVRQSLNRSAFSTTAPPGGTFTDTLRVTLSCSFFSVKVAVPLGTSMGGIGVTP